MISIIVRNEAPELSEADFQANIAAVNSQLANEFLAAWGIAATLVPAPAGTTEDAPNSYNVAFKSASDEPGDLGYHLNEQTGFPAAYVFMKDSIADGDLTGSICLSHETIEMLIDPGVNLTALGPLGTYPKEGCDAVEGDAYFAPNGVKVSDFLFPAWFQSNWPANSAASSRQYDHLDLIQAPFTLRPTGYTEVLINGQWETMWGNSANQGRIRHRKRG